MKNTKRFLALTGLVFANGLIVAALWNTSRNAATGLVNDSADPLVREVMENKFGDVSAREGLFARQLRENGLNDLRDILGRIEDLEQVVFEIPLDETLPAWPATSIPSRPRSTQHAVGNEKGPASEETDP